MATNYYGGGGGGTVEPTKMDDYGYGTDHLDTSRDMYSFGSYSTQPQQTFNTQQPQHQQQYLPGMTATDSGQIPPEELPKKKPASGLVG